MMHGTRVAGFAVKVVNAIVDDFAGRKGLHQEWEAIDDDIKNEIVGKWRSIAIQEAERWLKTKQQ